MNKNDLKHLRDLIENLMNFSSKHSNTLNKDSAPLWTYAKEKYNITLDAMVLNDLFIYLNYLGLSNDDISDEELNFINYIFAMNFTKEDLIEYLNSNLNISSDPLPNSFIFFYEFDKYLEDNGVKSQEKIVESLYNIYESMGLAFIALDSSDSVEKNTYDSYMANLRKNLDDLKKYNYALLIMSLNTDLINSIVDSTNEDSSNSSLEPFSEINISEIDPSSPDVLIDNLNKYFKENTHVDLGDIFKGDSDGPIRGLDINYDALEKVINGGSQDPNILDGGSKDSDIPNENSEEFGIKVIDIGDSYNVVNDEDESQKDQSSKEESQEEEQKEDDETLEEVMEKLNKLVGLETVKNDVNSLINLIQIRKIREERGIKQPDMSLHLVFSGNPGTGKTTVARLLSKIYCKMGLLSKGHLVETDRSGLVAGYVGQTAIKTQDMIKEAMGGILFIDEAYSLSSSKGENDYGQESIDTILKAMEDNREDFIVIVAGYPDLMDEFLHSNPGLESRFNKHLFFEDYNPKELFDIFVSMAAESSLVLDKKAETFLKGHFEDIYESRGDNFANGRYVRNLFEKVLSKQANRLVSIEDISDDDLNTLVLEDFEDCV